MSTDPGRPGEDKRLAVTDMDNLEAQLRFCTLDPATKEKLQLKLALARSLHCCSRTKTPDVYTASAGASRACHASMPSWPVETHRGGTYRAESDLAGALPSPGSSPPQPSAPPPAEAQRLPRKNQWISNVQLADLDVHFGQSLLGKVLLTTKGAAVDTEFMFNGKVLNGALQLESGATWIWREGKTWYTNGGTGDYTWHRFVQDEDKRPFPPRGKWINAIDGTCSGWSVKPTALLSDWLAKTTAASIVASHRLSAVSSAHTVPGVSNARAGNTVSFRGHGKVDEEWAAMNPTRIHFAPYDDDDDDDGMGLAVPWGHEPVQQVERNLCALIDKSEGERIMATRVVGIYMSEFGVKLDYTGLGYKKLKALIDALDAVDMRNDVGQTGYEYICRSALQGLVAEAAATRGDIARWEVHTDNGWKAFPPFVSAKLARAVADKIPDIEITVGGTAYHVDLVERVWRRTDGHGYRQGVRQVGSRDHASQSTQRKAARWQVQTDLGWTDYARDVSAAVEQAQTTGERRVEVTITTGTGPTKYTLDLSRLVQQRADGSGPSRPIRPHTTVVAARESIGGASTAAIGASTAAGRWQVQTDLGWTDYPRDVSAAVEQAQTTGKRRVEVTITTGTGPTKYTLDLSRLVQQRADGSGPSRPIRAHVTPSVIPPQLAFSVTPLPKALPKSPMKVAHLQVLATSAPGGPTLTNNEEKVIFVSRIFGVLLHALKPVYDKAITHGKSQVKVSGKVRAGVDIYGHLKHMKEHMAWYMTRLGFDLSLKSIVEELLSLRNTISHLSEGQPVPDIQRAFHNARLLADACPDATGPQILKLQSDYHFLCRSSASLP